MMKLLAALFIIASSQLIGIQALGQENLMPAQKNVTGRVTDSSGGGLEGVSVRVKGSLKGAMTDAEGAYSIEVAPDKTTLIFSFVGMVTREISVGKNQVVNVSMVRSDGNTNDVVVVGYSTQKRVNVVGSIAQIGQRELNGRPVARLSNALAGQMSGVTVVTRNGKPGSGDGQIRVRGVGSFGADPGALIIVDGVPLTSVSTGNLAQQASEGQEPQPYGGATSSDINSINPNDIETITVLKDAASAAIYGSRAANGVILITTKRGKAGKARIDYNGYVGNQSPTAMPQMASSVDFAKALNRASPGAFTDQQIATLATSGPNNNWLEQVMSGSGLIQQHNVSIAGGQKSNSYYVSFGYLNQNGVVQKTNYKRYNGRVNLTAELLKNVNLSVQLAATTSARMEPNVSKARDRNGFPTGAEGLLFASLQMNPTVLDKTPDGQWASGNRSQGTPSSWLASNSFRSNPSRDLNTNATLSWAPVEGLTLSATGAYVFTSAKFKGFQASQPLFPAVPVSLTSSLFENDLSQTYRSIQGLADYKFNVGDRHHFGILGGYSFEGNETSTLLGIRQNVPNNYLVLDMGSVVNMQTSGNTTNWAMQSQFARFKYDFSQKYLFEATARVDASSRFPVESRYAFFPSVAAGWRISEEDFFKNNFRRISNLKLKASWGELGNQNIGDYPYQQVYTAGYNYPFGDVINNGVALASYKDPTLRWETARTFDIGLESGFFANALTFNFTYFSKNTFDILYSPNSSISRVIGTVVEQINTGSLQNKGLEVELGFRSHSGKFNYNIQSNFTYIDNKVKSLGIGSIPQPNGYVGAGGGPFDQNLFIGYPLQMYYGYKTDGVFMPEDLAGGNKWPDQKLAVAKANYVPQAGDIRYRDISGPNGVPDGLVDPVYDKTYLGSRIPKYNAGLNISFEYKGIDLIMFWQGVTGVQGILNRNQGWAFYNTGNIQNWQIEQAYDPNNPQRYPKYPRLEAIVGGPDGNYQVSDFWVMDGSYIRLKNVQLGYSLSKKILQKLHIEKARFYISGENILTFSHYRPGWDPETNTVGNGFFYPILKTVSVGVNINL
jgi:TonB-linked SusC/RagA family outer membrane protein